MSGLSPTNESPPVAARYGRSDVTAKKVRTVRQLRHDSISARREQTVALAPEGGRQQLTDRATLTIPEVALLLRISERTARSQIKIGAIPSIRFGRRVVIPVPRLEAMLLDGRLANE